MKKDKCGLLKAVCAEEATLIDAQLAKVSCLLPCHWIRNCLRNPHLYNSNVAILNWLALVHYKFIWSRSHLVRLKHDSSSLSRTTAMFHLCYLPNELQWTSMLWTILLLT